MNPLTMQQAGACLLRTRNHGKDTAARMTRKRLGDRGTSSSNQQQTRNFRASLWRGSKKKGGSRHQQKPKMPTPGGSKGPEALWCTSKTATVSSSRGQHPLDMGKYGLKRLDYTTMKPPVWTAPPHPPTKTMAERVVFPLTLAVAAGVVLWMYVSPEEDDMTEYWKRVESGRILLDDDDDDDDYEDDEDEDEDA
mmetsp:Transcript_16480/g.33889  ORF Transcript_16480/g.33889 Transcript_16480/m.33889 type:complete len:194 (+) Transcript_16480:224-805(+)